MKDFFKVGKNMYQFIGLMFADLWIALIVMEVFWYAFVIELEPFIAYYIGLALIVFGVIIYFLHIKPKKNKVKIDSLT